MSRQDFLSINNFANYLLIYLVCDAHCGQCVETIAKYRWLHREARGGPASPSHPDAAFVELAVGFIHDCDESQIRIAKEQCK